MKKTLLLLLLLLAASGLIFASINSRVSFSNEISKVSYNRIWTSPKEYYYSIESISLNPQVESNVDFLLGKNFGLSLLTEVGYKFSIYDGSRFATFPKMLNGTAGIGFVGVIKNNRVSLSAALRSSFQTSRNNWISQVGGILDCSYAFDNGMTIIGKIKYFYSYELVDYCVSFGLGYSFGGAK